MKCWIHRYKNNGRRNGFERNVLRIEIVNLYVQGWVLRVQDACHEFYVNRTFTLVRAIYLNVREDKVAVIEAKTSAVISTMRTITAIFRKF